MMKKKNWWIILLIVMLVSCLCCCAAFSAMGIVGFGVEFWNGFGSVFQQDTIPFPEDGIAPPSAEAYAMLDVLDSAVVPENDPRDLAYRLKGIRNIPDVIPAKDYAIGDTETFWASNMDNDENFQVTTRLAAETEHAYVWIEDGVDYEQADLERLISIFEDQIYPINREFFGSEFSPGIDDDVHIYLVYARSLGSNIAGYFSANDSLPPVVYPYSNAHETFFFNADVLKLGDEYTLSTLAHEFQHMIHWHQDRNESTWVNEGFSELATVLNGYSPGGFDMIYLMNPDVQLNVWPVEPADQSVHYGSSFLFMQYFLSRFGEEATKALVANPLNDMAAIDAVLSDLDFRHPETGERLHAEDVFSDWAVANVINDAAVNDGQYAYQGYNPMDMGLSILQETIKKCPTADWVDGNVHQFGVDRVNLNCKGDYALQFEGIGEVPLLPVSTDNGDFMFWSNKGSESDMRLTRQFDLRDVQEPAALRYSVWFDLEEDYDYVYVLASENGETWEFLETQSGTDRNPVGSNLGWGYTGASDGWLTESVDLGDYAGKQVTVRFEYITDANLNGEGFLIDEISLDAIGYQNGFENDDGGWFAEGFARVENRLAQTFVVSVIYQAELDTVVDTFQFDGGTPRTIPLHAEESWDNVVILISGTTRYTQQPAVYRLQILSQE